MRHVTSAASLLSFLGTVGWREDCERCCGPSLYCATVVGEACASDGNTFFMVAPAVGGSGVGVSFGEFRFLEEPSDTVVSKDGPALLNCSAAGDPKPTISWKREGTLLHLINDPRRSILLNGSLHFRSVHHTRAERPDEGVYQCVATIPNVGTMLSRSAKLQVAALPRFDEQPRDLPAVSGPDSILPVFSVCPAPQRMLFG
ncbi:hypothetical protein MTO96_007077 [Rhipicephalus appendiculatus]